MTISRSSQSESPRNAGGDPDSLTVKSLRKAIREAETAIDNLWRMIETGQSVDMLTERLEQRRAEKAELEKQLTAELNRKVYLSEPQVMAYLDYIRTMPLLDLEKRRAIINIFVHAVYL